MSTIPSVPTNTTLAAGSSASTASATNSQRINPAQAVTNPPTITLSRAQIGAMIQAHILQVKSMPTDQTNATAAATASQTTSPLLSASLQSASLPSSSLLSSALLSASSPSTVPTANAALVYTPASLEQLALEQLASRPLLFKTPLLQTENQPLPQDRTKSLPQSLQLATISQQYQLLAEIGGKRVQLFSSLPLRVGEWVLLQKISAHAWQVLTPHHQPIKTTAFLPAFVAKTQPSTNWLQLAWQLSSPGVSTNNAVDHPFSPPQSMPPLPGPLKQFFQTLLSVPQLQAHTLTGSAAAHTQTAPSSKATQLVQLLKTSINNSGLTFEHKLAAFSRLPANEQNQLLQLWQQGSTTRQDINFTQDQKYALANLFNALLSAKQSATDADNRPIEHNQLIQWLTAIKKLLPTLTAPVIGRENNAQLRDQHPLWQSFFFPTTPMPAANQQEEQAQLIVQFMEQIKQQINRTHVQQLQSLLPNTDTQTSGKENLLSFCFDLPLLTNSGYQRIPIWIEGEHIKANKTHKPRSQWRVVLAFELPDLGKIIADCRLTPPENQTAIDNSALQMQFFSESSATNHCIDQHIYTLTHSLQAMGIDVSHQACRSPLPPLGDQRFQHDWVHLQI